MKKNLIAFLFGESQVDDEIAGIVESIADMDTDGDGDLKVEKKPLATALSALGIEDKTIENDPRGLSLVFGNAEEYRSAHAILNEPDSLHKLAELGWVASPCGDVAMTNEPSEFRIRFLEIDNVEAYDTKATYSDSDKARLNKVKAIIKKGREFATEEPDFDDDECNPVDHSNPKKGAKDKGVGSASDGSDPDGKPKGSTGSPSAGSEGSAPGKGDLTQPKEGDKAKLAKSESIDWAKRLKGLRKRRGETVGEGRTTGEIAGNAEFLRSQGVLHAEGCECRDCQSDPIGMSTAASRGPGPARPHMKDVEARVRPEVDAIHKPHDQTSALLRAHGMGESTSKKKDAAKKDSDSDDHEHVYGKVERSRLAGNPHRKCTIPGCKHVSLDLSDELDEGAHKSGCQCGFCKNKGNIGNWKKGKKAEKPEKEEGEVEESTAAEIVNSMLEGNPGTPPPVLGKGKDRGFKPAKGMVQAAPEGSIVAKQTKPNRSA